MTAVRRLASLSALAAATAIASACAGSSPGRGDANPEPTQGTSIGLTGAITVFAAASLTDTVTTLARSFQADHPGTRIRLNFGGSSGLARSIVDGAPADLFAAASTATMQSVTGRGMALGAPVVLARNVLEIATAPGNPRRVNGLADALRPGVTLALCAPQVPCGASAQKAFAAAGLRPRPVTFESDVKAVLTKVRLGEVDVGLVYRTDVLAAGRNVAGVNFPQAASASTEYPAVALRRSPHPQLAAAFLRHLSSPQAARVLRRAGFLPP